VSRHRHQHSILRARLPDSLLTGATVFVDHINADPFQGWVLIRVVYSDSRKATFAQHIVDLPISFALPALHVVYVGPFFFLCLLVQGFSVFVRGKWNTSTFLTSYIRTLVFLGFYFGRIAVVGRDDPWMIAPEQIDLLSGLAWVRSLREKSLRNRATRG
jgi:amino acid transporter